MTSPQHKQRNKRNNSERYTKCLSSWKRKSPRLKWWGWVKQRRYNNSHKRSVGAVCNFLSSISHNKNLKRRTSVAALWWTSATALWYSSVYLGSRGEYILEVRGHDDPKDEKTERPLALWLLFLYIFLLPLDLPYVNWASQERCLFYLRPSLQFSDLPLFYFLSLFHSLSFSHCHGLLFPTLTT